MKLKLLALALAFIAQPALAQSIVVDKPSTTGNPGVVKVTNTAGNKSNAEAVVVLNADGTIFTGAVTCTDCATAANQVTAQTTLDALNTKAGVANAVLNSILVKQPALGTAGTPSADYISVQNAAATPMFVSGTVASAATDSGNPVKMGCVYNLSQPTFATGQRADAQCSSRGEVLSQVSMGTVTPADAMSNAATAPGVPGTPGAARPLMVYQAAWNSSTWNPVRTIVGAVSAGTGNLAVSTAPHSAAAGALAAGASPSVEGSRVACAAACNSYGFSVTSGGSAGYLMAFNATSAPADGAVTPIMCRVIAANATLEVGHGEMPMRWSTGLTLVFSTTGCFTKTISATAFFDYRVL